ncbi:MAG: ribosomal protein S18-alanine N-acetyltransferase [Pseudomonadota bacterium]|nr:ribosomal protein S18-alanine N-acetyltransferase [Pseudomonadota bacterium]
MNAALRPLEAQFETMTPAWLEAVLQVERSAYEYPWSPANFTDSLQAGYQAQLLIAGQPPGSEVLGYFVAMKGVDEVHLLNITVAPAHQGQGWARVMLDALDIWTRGQGVQWLWLEVRVGNTRARSVYESHGFRHVGTRRNYYPATPSTPQGEDALVMSLALL